MLQLDCITGRAAVDQAKFADSLPIACWQFSLLDFMHDHGVVRKGSQFAAGDVHYPITAP